MLIAASCGALAGCEVSPGLAPSDRVAQNMDKMTKHYKNIWMLFSGIHKLFPLEPFPKVGTNATESRSHTTHPKIAI